MFARLPPFPAPNIFLTVLKLLQGWTWPTATLQPQVEGRKRIGIYMSFLRQVSLFNSRSHLNCTTCCIEPFKHGQQKQNSKRKGAILTVNFLKI